MLSDRLAARTGQATRQTTNPEHFGYLRLRKSAHQRVRAAHYQLLQRKTATLRDGNHRQGRTRSLHARRPRMESHFVSRQCGRLRFDRKGNFFLNLNPKKMMKF